MTYKFQHGKTKMLRERILTIDFTGLFNLLLICRYYSISFPNIKEKIHLLYLQKFTHGRTTRY
jgi:hypothetical protein